MRITRKGFTLVELLIVITLIGLLGTMMLVSGSDAQNAAKVAKITEGFRNLTAAVLMYNDAEPNKVAAAISGKKPADIVTGAKKYVRNEDVFGTTVSTAGTYYVAVQDSSLWLTYCLPGKTGVINDMLAAKATEYGLKSAVNAKPKSADVYAGGQTVYVNVF